MLDELAHNCITRTLPLGQKEILAQKNYGSKRFKSKKSFWLQKDSRLKKLLWTQKIFGSVWVQNIYGTQSLLKVIL